MKVLVVGATGMFGSVFFTSALSTSGWDVYGTVRSFEQKKLFHASAAERLLTGVDVTDFSSLERVFKDVDPDIVMNCAGITKHVPGAADPLVAIPVNALAPYLLADLCARHGARLVHISTDCVFNGEKGNYVETDPSDATDIYGKSKYLGEVDAPHVVTLRTSTIGHEIQSKYSLLEWFLSQEGQCQGYTKAIFSGLPTIELAELVRGVIVPRPQLTGLYHVAAKPISKYDLLTLVAKVYGKRIDIEADDTLVVDRSLNADKFNGETGYIAPTWPDMIEKMFTHQKNLDLFNV